VKILDINGSQALLSYYSLPNATMFQSTRIVHAIHIAAPLKCGLTKIPTPLFCVLSASECIIRAEVQYAYIFGKMSCHDIGLFSNSNQTLKENVGL
jgi:hypothetical protein